MSIEAQDLTTTATAVNDPDPPRSALERLEDAIAEADAQRERTLATAKAEYAREVQTGLEINLAGLETRFDELDQLEHPFDLKKVYRAMRMLRDEVSALGDWISELTEETQA
jgi:hypothetical protein